MGPFSKDALFSLIYAESQPGPRALQERRTELLHLRSSGAIWKGRGVRWWERGTRLSPCSPCPRRDYRQRVQTPARRHLHRPPRARVQDRDVPVAAGTRTRTTCGWAAGNGATGSPSPHRYGATHPRHSLPHSTAS